MLQTLKKVVFFVVIFFVFLNFQPSKISLAALGDYAGVHFDTAASGATFPVGAVFYDGFFWITNVGGGNTRVYKYDTSGVYTGISFDTSGSGNSDPYGIAAYDDFFWITDVSNMEVHKYAPDGTYTEVSFDTEASGNLGPAGIAFYEGFFWVTVLGDTELFKYEPDGTYTGISFDLAPSGNTSPTGVLGYDGFLWIANSGGGGEIYKYELDGTYTGVSVQLTANEFPTPFGIAEFDNYFWVIDLAEAEVYKYEGPDVVDPTITLLSPGDDATDVATGVNLVVTFDEDVNVGTGDISIYDASDDSIVEAIDVTGLQVTGDGTDVITINPSSNLDEETNYYVQIEVTAFDDLFGNSFAGILDETTWNFTTADETAPVISEVTAIGTTEDTTPSYTFNSDEGGDITYGGSCSSPVLIASIGDNTITLDELDPGTYGDCTITVTDSSDNESNILSITSFSVEEESSGGSSGSSGGSATSNSNPTPQTESPPPISDPDPILPSPTPVQNPEPPIIEEPNPTPPIEEPEESPSTPTPEISISGESEDSNSRDVSTNTTNQDANGEPLKILLEGLDQAGEKVEEIGEELVEFIETPKGSTVTKVVTTTGVTVTALGAIMSNVFGLADVGLNILRLWSLLLYGLGLKKRNRPWGTVYDSVTKQPLDPAYVVLTDMKGKEVATSITDLDGRYGFLVEPGTYRIGASKTNYTFPSLKLKGKIGDELYNDLYFGEPINIVEVAGVITKNIPLDPVGFDWNEFAKRDQKKMKFYKAKDLALRRFVNLLFYLGFALSILVLFVIPGPYNVIIFCFYFCLFIFRNIKIRRKRKGGVTEEDKIPLSYGILRVKSQTTGQEVSRRVLDKFGNYFCLVPNGRYVVEIEKKNLDGSYSRVYTSTSVLVTDGILRENFKII